MIKRYFLALILLATTLNMASAEALSSPTKADLRQHHRDSVRANKKIWVTPLGGPSYTPEASLGVAGAVLLSFRMNERDTLSQRSYLPMGVNASINGTIVVAGAGVFFFNENRFRIYSNYGVRNEPANFYGVGFDQIDGVERGELTTEYHKTNIYLLNRFVWELKPKLYLGPTLDVNYTKSSKINDFMMENSYVNRYKTNYTNIGLGAIVQYDTRDDVATPNSGLLLSAMGKLFARGFGGTYNYQFIDLEYRQFQPLFGRATLAWTARAQITGGDVPFTDLPMFGSPFDLRGFYWGQYRDRSMGYGIAEFRHMLGSKADYDAGRAISKFGYVVWAGAGTLGRTPSEWDRYKINYGVGLRAQIQPRKNFRVDIGKGQGEDGVLVYFNMTEAF